MKTYKEYVLESSNRNFCLILQQCNITESDIPVYRKIKGCSEFIDTFNKIRQQFELLSIPRVDFTQVGEIKTPKDAYNFIQLFIKFIRGVKLYSDSANNNLSKEYDLYLSEYQNFMNINTMIASFNILLSHFGQVVLSGGLDCYNDLVVLIHSMELDDYISGKKTINLLNLDHIKVILK
jgi:hypothetical protein